MPNIITHLTIPAKAYSIDSALVSEESFFTTFAAYSKNWLKDLWTYNSQDVLLNALLFSLLLIAILTLGLNLFIIFARFRNNAHRARKARNFERWEKELLVILDGKKDIESLIDLVEYRDWDMFAEFLQYFLENIKGKEAEIIREIYRKTGLLDRELNLLANAVFSWRRALSAARLGQLKTPRALDPLIQTLSSKSNLLVYAAAKAIMQIGDMAYIRKTLMILMGKPGLSEELFAEILLVYGKPINTELLDILKVYKDLPEARMRIIDFLGYFQTVKAVPILIQMLKTTHHLEERIRLVKALGHITVPEVPPILLTCLHDKNPVIRAQAAKGLGNFQDEKTIRHLAPLLEDEDWWCRTHAAYAIFKTGATGQEYLKQMLKETSDRYARDMIKQVLEKAV